MRLQFEMCDRQGQTFVVWVNVTHGDYRLEQAEYKDTAVDVPARVLSDMYEEIAAEAAQALTKLRELRQTSTDWDKQSPWDQLIHACGDVLMHFYLAKWVSEDQMAKLKAAYDRVQNGVDKLKPSK
jgi:hypothetical protein